MHALTHSHTHTLAGRVGASTLTHSHAHTLTHSHTHTLTHSHTHTLTHSHSHTHPVTGALHGRGPAGRRRGDRALSRHRVPHHRSLIARSRLGACALICGLRPARPGRARLGMTLEPLHQRHPPSRARPGLAGLGPHNSAVIAYPATEAWSCTLRAQLLAGEGGGGGSACGCSSVRSGFWSIVIL